MIEAIADQRDDQEVGIRVYGRPYVPAFINGIGPFWLLFDTGCIGCRITPQVAQKLDLEVGEDEVTCLRTFNIGSTRWNDVKFGVSDESSVVDLIGREIDGFLGNGFIYYVRTQFYVAVNYPRRTIAFRKTSGGSKPSFHAGKSHPARGSLVPVKLENYYPIVPVHIDGEGSYRFLLDTGASRCIVSPEVAQSLRLSKGEACKARGAIDVIDAYRSSVSRLSVGSARCEDLQVSVMDCSHVGSYVHDRVDGYIGTNFLEHFVMTLNYRDQTLTLQ
ncbi:MAG: aspartyl protease family protein [Candidatus Latescibacteria bacterium]|nr:aspartyl protease family protein [Candidatus Latescibacterota bacterium]